MKTEIDNERPGRAACLNLGISPDSTIGKIICGQAAAIDNYQTQNYKMRAALEHVIANDKLIPLKSLDMDGIREALRI